MDHPYWYVGHKSVFDKEIIISEDEIEGIFGKDDTTCPNLSSEWREYNHDDDDLIENPNLTIKAT